MLGRSWEVLLTVSERNTSMDCKISRPEIYKTRSNNDLPSVFHVFPHKDWWLDQSFNLPIPGQRDGYLLILTWWQQLILWGRELGTRDRGMDLRCPDGEPQTRASPFHPSSHWSVVTASRQPLKTLKNIFKDKAASCSYVPSVSRIERMLQFPTPAGILNTSWERTGVVGYLYNPGLLLKRWEGFQKPLSFLTSCFSLGMYFSKTLVCFTFVSLSCISLLGQQKEQRLLSHLSLSNNFIMFQNPYSNPRSLDNYSCFIHKRHILSFVSFPKPCKKHLFGCEGHTNWGLRTACKSFSVQQLNGL